MIEKFFVSIIAKFTTGCGADENDRTELMREVEMRGFGSCRAKSLALLSVSVQPPPMRVSDWFAGGTGAGAPSKQVLVP